MAECEPLEMINGITIRREREGKNDVVVSKMRNDVVDVDVTVGGIRVTRR